MSLTFRSGSIKKELFSYLMNFHYAVRLDKPLLTARIVRDYLNVMLRRRIPLRYVDIAVDYGCNLNCVHCSAERLKRDRHARRLTVDDYAELARQCHDLGVITVGITGGEPLVYPKLEQVIKAFRPGRTMISIKTNGVLLNDTWLRRLRSWKVDSISIGMGPVPTDLDDYDGVRGLPDTFNQSLGAAERAKAHGFRVILGVVVSHANIHSEALTRLLEYTAERGMILIFGLAVPAGNWSGDEEIILQEPDRLRIRELLLKYPHARTDFESNFCTRGCGAVNEKLYITPYGDVMPCPFVQIGLGNVLDEPLQAIRARALEYPVFRGYPERCLAADDYAFIDECIAQTFYADKLPLDHSVIPAIADFDERGNPTQRSRVPDLQEV